MKALHIIAIVFFSFLALVGLGTYSNDVTGAAAWNVLGGMFGLGYSITSLCKHKN